MTQDEPSTSTTAAPLGVRLELVLAEFRAMEKAGSNRSQTTPWRQGFSTTPLEIGVFSDPLETGIFNDSASD